MKPFAQLKVGFSDAENYRRRENKELFNSIFVRTEGLDKLCDPRNCFLIGEKGTGKTAYAAYLSNVSYHDHLATIRYIRETEYQKFIALKKERHLDLSDYAQIWKVILYLLIGEQIADMEPQPSLLSRGDKFEKLRKAVKEYYAHAFSPEIAYALQFVEKSELAAKLLSKYLELEGSKEQSFAFSESRFQTNLLYIRQKFEDALSSLRLKYSHILFIDGIDIRPSSVPYVDYLECIKGLANAVWSVNNDFFAGIKDSHGRMRVVLLIRPDIFESLGLQNQNTKIRDNSILLDWRTTYAAHRSSDLFRVTDRLLAHQQEAPTLLGKAWDTYFPFDTPNVKETFDYPSSFVLFVRYSLYRPRDVITMLGILQENLTGAGRNNDIQLFLRDIESVEFKNKYSSYLLGEAKDHLSFYYSKADYEIFLKFFEFLHGSHKFGYSQYVGAYDALMKYLKTGKKLVPQFLDSANDFLQFLFDLNIICYIEQAREGDSFFRWCFRERTYANISPKVKAGCSYEIHYGLTRALNLGRKLRE